MTRITNFARKRTHVEATFNYNEADLEDSDAESIMGGAADESATAVANTEIVEIAEDGRGADGQPPKKKRKRGPRKKAGTKVTTGTTDGGEGGEKGEGEESNDTSKKKGKKNKTKLRTIQGSPPLAASAHSKFTQSSSRAQRSFRKTTAQANSRAERRHHLFRLSREGPRRA